MVSLDTPEKNAEFARSLEARHVVLSDPEGKVASAYGVAGLGGFFAKRWTYYIDRDGIVRHVDKNVQVETAGQDIARKLAELGFPRR
jgi:peroxiredoxin Q/BCP